MPQEHDESYLTVAALAEKLSYDPNYIRILVRSGNLPGHKILGQWRFLWSEVEKFNAKSNKAKANGSGNGPQSKTEATDLLS